MTKDRAVACPLCRSEDFKILFDLAPDRVARCRSCELVFAISPPIEKTAIYNENYFKGEHGLGYTDYQAEFESHRETFLGRLGAAEKRLGFKGQLLDYGCAYGHLGRLAKDTGWHVFATDISIAAARRAKDEHGLHAFVSDLTQPPVKNACFDIVTLYDVIEHVPDPLAVLKHIAPMLVDGGYLHITTPDVTSLSARLMGRHWYHYKAQEHLLYFSPDTIQTALEHAGFEVLVVERAPSRMRIRDILARARRYSRALADVATWFSSILGIDRKIVEIPIGEMQIWARPKTKGRLSIAARKNQLRATSSVLNVRCCPTCRGTLEHQSNAHRLLCGSCQTPYEVVGGVPVLTPKDPAIPASLPASA